MPRHDQTMPLRRRRRARWEALRLGSCSPRRVHVTLHTHTLADFVFYGLYGTDRFDLGGPTGLADLLPADRYGHFPQYVAMRQAALPAELPGLLESYFGEELASYDLSRNELRTRVAALAPRFDAYLPFWHERVFPLESQLLGVWREQLSSCDVLDLFQRVTRMHWPFPGLRLFACYHHPSGSALTPYPCLFSTLFDRYSVEPSAAWFLGHEATHLLLDAAAWWEHPDAPAAIRWLGSRYLAEEPLCLLLQNRLTTICGLLPESEMQVLSGTAKHFRVYRWLQEHWEEYLDGPERFPTLVDYFLAALQGARKDRRGARSNDEPYAATARAA